MMMTFDQYQKGEKGSPPPAVEPKKQAALNHSLMQNLRRAKLIPATVGDAQPCAGDVVGLLSHQIIDLNRFIVTDPSCAVVAKTLAAMVLRLHFLMLISIAGTDDDANRRGNA
jgi:hypothetical protein